MPTRYRGFLLGHSRSATDSNKSEHKLSTNEHSLNFQNHCTQHLKLHSPLATTSHESLLYMIIVNVIHPISSMWKHRNILRPKKRFTNQWTMLTHLGKIIFGKAKRNRREWRNKTNLEPPRRYHVWGSHHYSSAGWSWKAGFKTCWDFSDLDMQVISIYHKQVNLVTYRGLWKHIRALSKE